MRYIFGGENYYIAIFPPVCQGPFMRGGNLLYSHFPPCLPRAIYAGG